MKCPKAKSATQLPSQSAPTILKNRAPCFLKIGAPCFFQKAVWKKQGHSLFKKRRGSLVSSPSEERMTLFFSTCFLQKSGCPIFKNSGCRLTGRVLKWWFIVIIITLLNIAGSFFVWCENLIWSKIPNCNYRKKDM